jgi:hypothetical protein
MCFLLQNAVGILSYANVKVNMLERRIRARSLMLAVWKNAPWKNPTGLRG